MTPFRALFAGLAAAQVAYGLRTPRPRGTRMLVGLMLATSGAEAAQSLGRRRGPALLAVAGAIGFAAEIAGVATGRPFGRYEYSAKLGPRVAGVPLLAAAAWAMMARPAWVTAGRITRRPAARVPLAAGALTAWDAFLDPRMARDGYWRWPGGGRYEGVPASNFAGWYLTALAVFSTWTVVDRDAEGTGALALYVWTWIGETFANTVLWRRPVTAAGGALAMGAFAVPALLRSR